MLERDETDRTPTPEPHLYKVVAGFHHDKESGKKYAKGEIISSNKPLCVLFANKFEDLGIDPEAVPKQPPAGIDCTDDFDGAPPRMLGVVKQNGLYVIYSTDPDDDLYKERGRVRSPEAVVAEIETYSLK